MGLFRIRFITEPDWISTSIRVITNSDWSHTEIILPDGTYLGAHPDGGVKVRPANYCVPTRERRYSIYVDDRQLDKIMAFTRGQIGKPYDLTDIAGLLTHLDWHTKGKWICSEFVAAAAEAGLLYLLNAEPAFVSRITPEMLHLSPLLIGNCYYEFGV